MIFELEHSWINLVATLRPRNVAIWKYLLTGLFYYF